MPSPDSKGGGLVDFHSIRARDVGGGDNATKQRSKSSSTRRPSHGSSTPSGAASGPGTPNGTAKKVSHVPCKFYRQGVCQAGEGCPFSHDTEALNQSVCKYFQKGNCKFGSKCALAHITADGRRVNTKKDKPIASKSQQNQPPLTSPSSDANKHNSNGQVKLSTSATAATPLPSKNVSGSFSGSIFAPKNIPASASSSASAASVGSPRSNPTDEPKLPSSIGSDVSILPPNFLTAPVIGSPGTSRSSSGGLVPPLVTSTTVLNSHSSSARSSFSFSRAAVSSTTVRSSSFRSSNFTESQLFGSQRVGSMSRVGSSGSASIWAERLNPLAYEGSAIVDDDDEDEDDDDDEDLGEGFEEDLVPPSLSDLLTPQERERRNSRHSSHTRPAIISSPNASEFWSTARVRRPSSGQQARVLEPIGTPDKAGSLETESSSRTSSTVVGLGVCGSGPSNEENSDTPRPMSSH